MKKLKICFATLLSLLTILSLFSCKTPTPADTSAEVIYYTVSFSNVGKEQLSPRKVLQNSSLSAPPSPTRDGYIFSRWTYGGKEWDFSTDKVTSDITLTAEWIDAGTVYEYERIGDGLQITAVKKILEVQQIPSVIGGLPVLAIADEVFADTSAEKTAKITVAESVTSIGKNAFRNCEDVEIVVDGDISSLGEGAFAGCNKLSKISLGSGLEAIPVQAFSTCSSLASIVISDAVKLIDENAFEDCTALRTLTVGAATERIADSAFIGCDALDIVKFNGNEQQFKKITIEGGNTAFELAEKKYMKD